MRPTPTRATRRFAAAAAVGLLAALALPGNPIGLGMLLVAVGIAATAATLGALPLCGPHASLRHSPSRSAVAGIRGATSSPSRTGR